MKKTLAVAFLITTWMWTAPTRVYAYPTAVIYIPTAEALPYGQVSVGAFALGSVSPELGFTGALLGATFSILPPGDTQGSFAFGGLELSADVIYLDPEPLTISLHAKLQLLRDRDWVPAIAVGVLGASPEPSVDVSLGYVVISKRLNFGEALSLGRLTAGLGARVGDASESAPDCIRGTGACLFRGSAPFEDENAALFLGYESPWLGPISLAVDHLGGVSLFSATSVALNVVPTHGLFFQAGASFAHDRRRSAHGGSPQDGLFLFVGWTADVFAGGATSER